MTYYFGVYHWRRRFRRLAASLLAGVLAVHLARGDRRGGRLLAVPAGLWAGVAGRDVLDSLLRPPPWALERYKYEALADALPTAGAERLLDVGCGTGRSLVGLAPAVPDRCRVVGLDVFDDRVILGNGPRLAARNAERAGLDVSLVRGDAARLPVADDTQDVVTACRVLHDLPADDARRALAEMRRVCGPDGAVGVLELPITHEDATAPPATYWREQVAAAGFAVETVTRVPRRGKAGDYVVVVGRTEPEDGEADSP